jgi:hypothetical protein
VDTGNTGAPLQPEPAAVSAAARWPSQASPSGQALPPVLMADDPDEAKAVPQPAIKIHRARQARAAQARQTRRVQQSRRVLPPPAFIDPDDVKTAPQPAIRIPIPDTGPVHSPPGTPGQPVPAGARLRLPQPGARSRAPQPGARPAGYDEYGMLPGMWRRSPAVPPSWRQVIATTVRLWLSRWRARHDRTATASAATASAATATITGASATNAGATSDSAARDSAATASPANASATSPRANRDSPARASAPEGSAAITGPTRASAPEGSAAITGAANVSAPEAGAANVSATRDSAPTASATGRSIRSLPWIRVAALVFVVLLAAAGGVVLSRNSKPGGQPTHQSNAVLAAQAARNEAAAWVAGQVSRNSIVSCDPVMCPVLQSHGYPGGNLVVLGPNAPDPLDSSVIVATGALRSQFGSRLTTVYAPLTLASFGTGSAKVDVRVVAPDGAPAYLRQLRADVAARKSLGAVLLRDPKIAAEPAARSQLSAGLVDPRLLLTMSTLSALHPLSIVSFGDAAHGAAAGVPLREAIMFAGIGESSADSGAGLATLASFLRGQQPPYLPAVIRTVRLVTGDHALRVQFAAPTPLGLINGNQPSVKSSS